MPSSTYLLRRSHRVPTGSRLNIKRSHRRDLTGSRLALRRTHRALAASRLAIRRSHWYRSGYDLTAVDVATGAETRLGFVEADQTPLQLDGITLPDGTYDIVIELRGYAWRGARLARPLRVVISGGQVQAAAPPPLDNVTFEQRGDTLLVRWTWSERFGTATPDEFAIWTDTAGPPDTNLPPAFTLPADEPRRTVAGINQGSNTLWIAIAARTAGGIKGPVSRIDNIGPNPAPTRPAGQFAERGK